MHNINENNCDESHRNRILTKVFKVPKKKIHIIEHGVPDFSKLLDVEGIIPDKWKDRKLMLTFGLLGRSKGIETVIKGMPAVVKKHPEILYVILGKTHPHIVEHSGEEYREYLEKLTQQLDLNDNILFINEYVSEEALMQYLKRADLYVTPYLNKTQITSGTLAYALGSGSVVISTPYWHAESLLAEGRGKLFNFSDYKALSSIIIDLLDDPLEMILIKRKAYNYGTQMIWPKIGKEYHNMFEEIKQRQQVIIPEILFENFSFSLPKFKSRHLEMLSDKNRISTACNWFDCRLSYRLLY